MCLKTPNKPCHHTTKRSTFFLPASHQKSLTGLLQSQLDGRTVTLVSLYAQHFPLPLPFPRLLLDLPLSLGADPQQPQAQDLVQPHEDVPVAVHVEEVVDLIHAPQLLGCRVVEHQLGFGRTTPNTIMLFRSPSSFIHIHFLFFFLFHIREFTSLSKQQVWNEVIHDLLDFVLVLFLDSRLPLHVVDDERGSIFQDLLVFIG